MIFLAATQGNQGTSYLIVALAGFWGASSAFRLRRKKMTGGELAMPASPAQLRSLAIAGWLLIAMSLFVTVAAILFLTVGPM
ncbi:hypothetical protein GCM10011579_028840 [Streptomyces albiflavescens]|uniref:Uncharacterized protein n=1 Tax=Streptomyces albiflavescens TaxID=1623582 RepID=A0A918D2V2_9ACTN|nr:hypothetical protein [Streptomyces albiflavescens]GGN62056.1 hypothetical protein GCM10011579_028840 [Streptomyces albiflavescens]